ncbi:MAG: hypothetical protein JNL67_13290 [Planctomycetaceae bacterium]|nr:hypothetical protein [Planctomycetaceae bacterium]
MINKINQHTETRSPKGQQTPTLPRIQNALNLAAQDAVELHREHGLPLVVWQDGKTTPIAAASVKPKTKARKPTGK